MVETKDILKFLRAIISLAAIIYVLYTCYIYLISFNASYQLYLKSDQEVLRIKIYGSSTSSEGNTVSGTFSIIDSNGNEIAVIERSLSGAYLGVEFVQSNFNGKYFVFPSKIYGKNRIIDGRSDRNKGISLEKYYDDYGQCMLLGYGSTFKDRRNMYILSAFSNGKYPVLNFGITSKYSLDLSSCKTNTYYSISYNRDGSFSLKEF